MGTKKKTRAGAKKISADVLARLHAYQAWRLTPELRRCLKYVLSQMSLGVSIAEACLEVHISPHDLYHAMQTDKHILAEYITARDLSLIVIADEIKQIADECPATKGDTLKAHLRIESRKWLLSKLMPRTYGALVSVEGAHGPVTIELRRAPAEALKKADKVAGELPQVEHSDEVQDAEIVDGADESGEGK